MKKIGIRAALGVAALCATLPLAAQATVFSGFTGPFAPGTFDVAFSGNVATGALVSETASLLTIVGADDPAIDPNSGIPACTGALTGFLGGCQVTVSHGEVGASDAVSFHWTYSTADVSPGYDIFGVLVDGVATILSDPGGPLSQSGDFAFTSANSFGFFVNCTDCVGGAATASVSAFQAAVVPEPGTVTLVFVGAAILFAAVRRRRPDAS